MDFEFSYNFAHLKRGKYRPGRHGPPPPKGPRGPQDVMSENYGKPTFPKPPLLGASYLYTLRNTEPLDKLIYLDGSSAAKTDSHSGEMDQQLILSRQLDPDQRVSERAAAEKICKWGKLFGLQGVIRLEIGFEIILCDFYDKIELVSNVTLHDAALLGNLPKEPPFAGTDLEKKRMELMDKWELMGGIDWLAAGSRINEGEPRILLDFSGLVTPLNKTYIDRDPYKRRLNHLPESHKEAIISLLESYLKKGVNPFERTNWETVTKSITEKFAPFLLSLNNTLLIFEYESNLGNLGPAIEAATENITSKLFNFFRRYSDDDLANWDEKRDNFLRVALSDYVYHTYELTSELEVLILSSIYKITSEILYTLRDLFETARNAIPDLYVDPRDDHYDQIRDELLNRKESLNLLLRVLSWPIFARCSKTCGWDEVCYVPTWGPSPFGWGSGNSRFLEFDGDRYRIPLELSCVSMKDMTVW